MSSLFFVDSDDCFGLSLFDILKDHRLSEETMGQSRNGQCLLVQCVADDASRTTAEPQVDGVDIYRSDQNAFPSPSMWRMTCSPAMNFFSRSGFVRVFVRA